MWWRKRWSAARFDGQRLLAGVYLRRFFISVMLRSPGGLGGGSGSGPRSPAFARNASPGACSSREVVLARYAATSLWRVSDL
jgi:hypothetical protein